MQPQAKTVGGGPATGLADSFVEFLKQGLTTGNFGNPSQAAFGANPIGSTQGIAGILNEILSPGAGKMGGSLQDIIANRQAGDIANLRSRYSMGGVGTGTPSAYAETNYRARAAPEAAIQIGQLQQSYLLPLLQMITGISGKGIPQAQTMISPSPFMQALNALSTAGKTVGEIAATGGGGAGAASLAAPQMTMPDMSQVPQFDSSAFMRSWQGNRTQSGFGGF